MIESGTWRRKPPTEYGWYWFQSDPDWKPPVPSLLINPGTPPAIVLIGLDGDGFFYCPLPEGKVMTKEMKGRWAGPIREPS